MASSPGQDGRRLLFNNKPYPAYSATFRVFGLYVQRAGHHALSEGVFERQSSETWTSGSRAEYTFAAKPPRDGGESAAAADFELERFLHLYALNRGVLLTPFHNMALMCPDTTSDIDRHTEIFASAVGELVS